MLYPRRPVVSAILSIIFFGLGAWLIPHGWDRYDAGRQFHDGVESGGTVTSVRQYDTWWIVEEKSYFVPEVTFTAANGRSYTFAGPSTSSAFKAPLSVEVSYLRNDPKSSRDISAGSGDSFGYVLVGAFLCAFGLLTLLVGLRAVRVFLSEDATRPASAADWPALKRRWKVVVYGSLLVSFVSILLLVSCRI